MFDCIPTPPRPTPRRHASRPQPAACRATLPVFAAALAALGAGLLAIPAVALLQQVLR